MPINLLPSSESPDLGSSDLHESQNVHETPNAVNPIMFLLHNQKVGKAVLNFAVPMTTGLLLNQYEKLTPHQAGLIAVTLCLGSAAIWIGLLLRAMYPGIASATENFGVGLVFVAFYGMVSSSIPSTLEWVPWLCCVLKCLPLVLSLFPVNSTGRTTQSNSPVVSRVAVVLHASITCHELLKEHALFTENSMAIYGHCWAASSDSISSVIYRIS